MHCVSCNSEELKMIGSLASPRWECKNCGCRKPPAHSFDTAPVDPETEELLYEQACDAPASGNISISADEISAQAVSNSSVCSGSADKVADNPYGIVMGCSRCYAASTTLYNGMCRSCFRLTAGQRKAEAGMYEEIKCTR